jgi:uncharacterized repeat protein (TIGR03803 family)
MSRIFGKCISSLALAALFPLASADAKTKETVLYSFQNGNDGGEVNAGVIADSKGNLYGTTEFGGGTGCYYNTGCGTIFKITPKGKETVLHSFCDQQVGECPNGAYPQARLIMDKKGNLFGTTISGGDMSCINFDGGCGTIFELARDGTYTVLHAFTNAPDGANPAAGLIMDKTGNLFGTTEYGGSGCQGISAPSGCGTVFRLAPDGAETVLYSFCSQPHCLDGDYPSAGVIEDKKGNLYGTTLMGGSLGNGDAGFGTVFKVSPAGTETVLYAFAGGTDGIYPEAGLLADGEGNLFGTTAEGGARGCGFTCGTVFKLSPDGAETVVYAFLGGDDGGTPVADLIADAKGNLYSTTIYGGGTGCQGPGCGTVFKVAPHGTETVLYSFTGGNDGGGPDSGLIMDGTGNLYSTTISGGAHDYGIVFELAR